MKSSHSPPRPLRAESSPRQTTYSTMPENVPATDLKVGAINLKLSLTKEDLVKVAVDQYRKKLRKQLNKLDKEQGRLNKEYLTREKETVKKLDAAFLECIKPWAQTIEPILGPLRKVSREYGVSSNYWLLDRSRFSFLERGGIMDWTGVFSPLENGWEKLHTTIIVERYYMTREQVAPICKVLEEYREWKRDYHNRAEEAREAAGPLLDLYYDSNFLKKIQEFETVVRANLAKIALNNLTGEDVRALQKALNQLPEAQEPSECK